MLSAEHRAGDGLLLTAFALMLAASLALLLVPAYSSGETLVEHEGGSVAALLLIPPAVAAIPIFAEQRRARPAVRAAVAFVMFVLTALALASIGVFYLPGTLALAVAAFRQ